MAKFFDYIKGLVSSIRKDEGSVAEGRKDSGMLIASGLSDDALKAVEELCSELGPRPAATKESRRAARKIASIFELYSDDVTITSARMYPNINKGFLIILTLIMIAMTMLSLFRMPYISLVILGLYIWGLIKEIRKEKSFLRRFLSTDEGANVHAVIEPEDTVLRTLVFSAHHDSAEIIRKGNGTDLHSLLSSYIPFASMALMGVLSVSELIAMAVTRTVKPGLSEPVFPLLSLIPLAASCISVFIYLRRSSSYSPGAGDNLSGVAAVTELLRYFSSRKECGHGLKNTRLIFVSFDGEECGAQGSAAWLSDNSHLLISPKMLNFDGLYKASELAFLIQDGNGLVALDSRLAAKCSSLASMMGHNVPIGRLGMLGGETDAVSAAGCGIPATTLTSMKPELRTPAHTADDTPDKVDADALKIAIMIGAKLAEDEDSTELSSENNEVPFLEDGKKYRLTK